MMNGQKRAYQSRNGLSRTPEYFAWNNMWGRCSNPSHVQWDDYGGRGIRVDERWRDFQTFLDDMGPRPSKKHSLDRYPDNNGHYEPSNCAWRTREQQNNNRRSNHIILFNGESKTLAQWAKQYGLPPRALQERLVKLGWPIEKALTTKLRPMRRWSTSPPLAPAMPVAAPEYVA